MGKMEPQGEMGFFADQFEANNMMGGENSESENYDTVSVEDHVDGGSQNTNASATKKAKRKRYHRHTPQQIQELENFFKSIAHPDEKQRLELGRRLGLEGRQVKFWFQNRRTQMKTQIERHENVSLKQEYDKLRLENGALKDAMRNPTCQDCGGAVIMGEVSMQDHELKIENERLKDELIRVTAMAEKFLGRPVSDLANQIIATSGAPSPALMGLNLPNGVSSTTPMNGSIMTSEYEKTMFMQVAMAAMDELLTMAQADSPLWFKSLEDGRELLNQDEYAKKFSPFVGMKPFGFITDATKEASTVFISSFELVETMMFPRRLKDTFPCMLGKADTIEVLFSGNGGSRDGELQLMNAEFLYPSPFVPLRQEKIIRFAKQHSQGMWAVVDVSVDMIRASSSSGSSTVKWRRLPSGLIVQDVANGYSLVTWVEHVEYDENCVHQLYRPLLRSGMAFGAQRWLASLQRERECVAFFMSPKIYPEQDAVIEATTPEGKRSIVKLMKRISNNFCSGLCASSSRRWEKLQIGGLSADVSIMSRICVNEPGEPSGVVLSASTSVWLPVPRQHLFDFLRDEKVRGKWDILANGGPMKVIACFPKSQNKANCVSLFCPPAAPPRESNMLILQESWSDRTGSFVVYAPVDTSLVESVLRGEDSDYVALLPSGFAICDGPHHSNEVPNSSGASILTMGFQILVNSLPTAKLTVESIETVSTLMSCTIQKIRGSLGC
ncbi:homeobox-leucine zipper protein HDG1-like [Silene latifolia]|uniref:homeobox-leucine zipper protein HDG1-like n=1 Tax=Silene latifolia TaxID=37657 RepID=UPI003D7791E0